MKCDKNSKASVMLSTFSSLRSTKILIKFYGFEIYETYIVDLKSHDDNVRVEKCNFLWLQQRTYPSLHACHDNLLSKFWER